MSALDAAPARRCSAVRRTPPEAPGAGMPRLPPLVLRLAPTALAAALALTYVLLSPPSEDLPAHLLRAKLFSTVGFGLWNNWWYAGHFTPGYSVLFPPLAAVLTPQVVGALAAVASAAVFESMARTHFGSRAWLGSLWFGAATAVDLYTGRLPFALGLLFALATAHALQRRATGRAALFAVLTPLASPVAALFAAVVAVAAATTRPDLRRAGAPLAVAAGALLPVGVLAVLFPEGGSEPYAVSALVPVVVIGVVSLLALRRDDRRSAALRAGIAVYVVGNITAALVLTPVGSNADRLTPLLAGPLAAVVWWPRRRAWLLAAALPLLYLQWQAPVRDLTTAWGKPAATAGFYEPLLRFLRAQPGGPYRIEIPFTSYHSEAYRVAPEFPLARGWERQLDRADNPLFYRPHLTAAAYDAWLHRMAIRYVAVANAPLDYSARGEVALIGRGVPDLRLVMRTRDWRVYAVRDPTPLAQGPATVTALSADSVSLRVIRPGGILLRVHNNPYWALSGVPGCVAPAGAFTEITATRAGRATLTMRFSLGRIGAHARRCAAHG